MKIAILFAVVFFTSTSVIAESPVMVRQCEACHGQGGHSTIHIYPSLAGLDAQYLESSLQAYKNKQFKGGSSLVMQLQAQSLTDEEIKALALYFSKM